MRVHPFALWEKGWMRGLPSPSPSPEAGEGTLVYWTLYSRAQLSQRIFFLEALGTSIPMK
jgi:hypothetical protein